MDVSPDFRIEPVRRPLAQHNPAPSSELLRSGPAVALHVDDTVLSGIRRQSAQQAGTEVGGILLGRHFVNGTGWIVTVTDHLAVPSDNASAVHFEFDQSSIQAIAARLADSVDEYIVGWYHSHVGGKPFMSGTDHKMHQAHFNAPWYVSAVVGAGEWGLPVGFWRLAGTELEALDDYLVRMTGPDSAAERHQRFLEECVDRDDDDRPSRPGPAELLPALGVTTESRLATLLTAAASPRRRWGTDAGIDQFRLLVEVALTAGADPGCVEELEAVQQRLRHTRGRQGRLRLASTRFKERIAVHRGECYSYTPGDLLMERFDISRRLVWPVRIESPPVSVHYDQEGMLWVLMANHHVLRMETSAAEDSEQGTRFRFQFARLGLPPLEGDPLEAVGDPEAVWVRTARQWHRLPLVQEGERTSLGSGTRGDLPSAQCRLLPRWKESGGSTPLLGAVQDGRLRLWRPAEDDGTPLVDIALDPPWDRWPVRDLSLGGDTLYALFDDDGGNQIAAFDLRTQRLTQHIVSVAGQESVATICTDHLGRLHGRIDHVLCRF
ncbi:MULTISPECIES: Mov34/MPN/PAD-1 family protein [unclassified Micromonospora]|uniref:Mov34/MPN/PAD-1 family protein n=1 Tax=unclassified Micromonospora TaxID=2617518 RepID=UPI001C5F918E|nr:Mov34/MPN/PAD-1 family protein [Micromonospora sp. RL09-050-HVF-A]MBW4700907.1 Mov34/MPN/PAD-1 family protein [Micromonospora sp. RL09-050-HVF-A]